MVSLLLQLREERLADEAVARILESAVVVLEVYFNFRVRFNWARLALQGVDRTDVRGYHLNFRHPANRITADIEVLELEFQILDALLIR